MDEILVGMPNNFFVYLCLTIGLIGVIGGLDLLFGARIIALLKNILDRRYDFDKAIVNQRVRVSLGFIIIILSLTILFLLTRVTI